MATTAFINIVNKYSFAKAVVSYFGGPKWTAQDEYDVTVLKSSIGVAVPSSTESIANMGQAFAWTIAEAKSAQAGRCPSKYDAYVAAALAIRQMHHSGKTNGSWEVQKAKDLIYAARDVCTDAADYNDRAAGTNTGGRVVTPEVKPVGPTPSAVDTSLPPAAKAGMSPWLLVGGLGLLALLFGKKKR